MTQINSYFKVADNSGVKSILAIRNLSKGTKRIELGDLIVGVVKEINSISKLLYSSIVYGVVIRIKKNVSIYKKYDSFFSDNAAVLVDKNLNPIGSRIFGSFPRFLKKKNCLKLHSITFELI